MNSDAGNVTDEEIADSIHIIGTRVIRSDSVDSTPVHEFDRTGVMPLALAWEGGEWDRKECCAVLFFLRYANRLVCHVQVFDTENAQGVWLENGACGFDWFANQPRPLSRGELGAPIAVLGTCGRRTSGQGVCEFIYGVIASDRAVVEFRASDGRTNRIKAGLYGLWVASARGLDLSIPPVAF